MAKYAVNDWVPSKEVSGDNLFSRMCERANERTRIASNLSYLTALVISAFDYHQLLTSTNLGGHSALLIRGHTHTVESILEPKQNEVVYKKRCAMSHHLPKISACLVSVDTHLDIFIHTRQRHVV